MPAVAKLPSAIDIGTGLKNDLRALSRAGFVFKASRPKVPLHIIYRSDQANGMLAVTYHEGRILVQAQFVIRTKTQTEYLGGEIKLVHAVSQPRAKTHAEFTRLTPLLNFMKIMILHLIKSARLAKVVGEF